RDDLNWTKRWSGGTAATFVIIHVEMVIFIIVRNCDRQIGADDPANVDAGAGLTIIVYPLLVERIDAVIVILVFEGGGNGDAGERHDIDGNLRFCLQPVVEHELL